jgi:hypothetical protein
MEDEIRLRALANDIIVALDKALVKFGTYSFDDKGADEVMETSRYTAQLVTLPAEQAGYVLKMVGAGRKDGRGETLRDFLAVSLDSSPNDDAWFEKMLETSGAEY